MATLNLKCSLGQISTLRDQMNQNAHLTKNFDLSNAFELLEHITLRQKDYIYYLMFNSKFEKLDKMLLRLKFNLKESFTPDSEAVVDASFREIEPPIMEM